MGSFECARGEFDGSDVMARLVEGSDLIARAAAHNEHAVQISVSNEERNEVGRCSAEVPGDIPDIPTLIPKVSTGSLGLFHNKERSLRGEWGHARLQENGGRPEQWGHGVANHNPISKFVQQKGGTVGPRGRTLTLPPERPPPDVGCYDESGACISMLFLMWEC